MAKISVVAPIKNSAERWVPPTSSRVTELNALRRAKIEEIVELEKAGMVQRPRQLGEDLEGMASRLLDGAPEPTNKIPAPPDPAYRLQELRDEIKLIDRAIEKGILRIEAEKVERARELLAQNASAWKALQRNRALAIAALFKANRQIAAMRSEILCGSSGLNLALDGFDTKLFGSFAEQNVTGHWPREFLKQAVKFGAISEKEVADNV